ncbi:hypothetical protein HJFPF1_10617 [Paramyrothecium foliicola]|nr:hypothetical protein HJFPF1_10617 [Paramyrothecium foliicola]
MKISKSVPCLDVATLNHVDGIDHVQQVAQQLERSGILKIRLNFHDPQSNYLHKLVHSLHHSHGHQLPIAHSAKRGFFWDVRPDPSAIATRQHQARSETMEEFPWHTDCSYEDPTPRYFALHVLQHDRFGGGTLSVLSVQRLSELLSPETRFALAQPEYQIDTPPEFIKDPKRKHIVTSLLWRDYKSMAPRMRFRADIIRPLTEMASVALAELCGLLQDSQALASATLHLIREDSQLPARNDTIINDTHHTRTPFFDNMKLTVGYSPTDVVAVAKIHPFYALNTPYPPDAEKIKAAREEASKKPTEYDLNLQPLLRKAQLPRNTFRHAAYISTTGGGSGSVPLLFATDVHENRRQRAQFGRFLQNLGVVSEGDWIVTTHFTGHLYRSLDLILEILENAGASVLAAGQHMSPAEVVKLIKDHNVNGLSGDSGQIVHIVHHISTLTKEERSELNLSKIIYTSEGLSPSQRSLIREVLGPIKIYSILGSAEAGPYAASLPHPNGYSTTTTYEDFVFDKRSMEIEIFSTDATEADSIPEPLKEGQQGVIAQTSFARLRNPLIRYITGDIGSLHPFPPDLWPSVPMEERQHLQVLRLQGRDRRFSFDWDGNYFEFDQLNLMMTDPNLGILQWQVVLARMEPSVEALLEIRLLCFDTAAENRNEAILVDRLETFFYVYAGNRRRFRINFVNDLDSFERSNTGRKVIRFVNKMG